MNNIFIFASLKHTDYFKMTKADIVSKISEKLGMEKGDVQATVESFMEEVKTSLEHGDNVYLRGFGSFIIKTRAEKTGRNVGDALPHTGAVGLAARLRHVVDQVQRQQ